MNIGVLNQQSFIQGKGENRQEIKYLELLIRPPFMPSATFTVSQNKNKQNDNEPDWIINYSFNRKGENYRRARVGAIWNKIKDDFEYKTGHIESPIFPNGRLNFSMFKAKVLEGEDPASVTWKYDVVWTHYDPSKSNTNDTNGEYSQAPQYDTTPTGVSQANIPQIDIDEDEIPF